eukprot:TRINITY_DN13080_c0_g1_i1.p1 TRINITY_DN13080_c0_g1~~TRINITY_DN13080_c0_g1_i1.p1  ORF type:complete len:526 (+),score=32.83 TRINITY_DN13080_c0_g1_i1:23-1579(+)
MLSWCPARFFGKLTPRLLRPYPVRPGRLKVPPQSTRLQHLEVSKQRNPPQRGTFLDCGLPPQFIEMLRSDFGIGSPTVIQKMAISAVLEGRDVLIASPTGTGKTLSYMLPLVYSLAEWLWQDPSCRPEKRQQAAAPRVLILVPTRQLAKQVWEVARQCCLPFGLRARLGAGDLRRCAEAMRGEFDILVATPSSLSKLNHFAPDLSLNLVEYVVIDEADVTLDRNNLPEINPIINFMSNRNVQFICVLATLTDAAARFIKLRFPHMSYILAPGTHKPPKQLKYNFVKCGLHEKVYQLLRILADENIVGKQVESEDSDMVDEEQTETSQVGENKKTGPVRDGGTMVFCNTRATCIALSQQLNDRGIANVMFHTAMHPALCQMGFARFSSGAVRLLVCTDAASRGLDTRCVRHVISYDFPHNRVDLLHRVGRAGRMGAGGRCSFLISRGQLKTAHFIEQCLRSGEPLSQLPTESEPRAIRRRRVSKRVAERRQARSRHRNNLAANQQRRKDKAAGVHTPRI